MSAPVLVGRETTHGTLASTLVTVGGFTAKNAQKNRVLDEQRSSQDTAFGVVSGRRWTEFSFADGFVYHDTIGLFLAAALGIPTVTTVAGDTTVKDNVFKFADDPASLSLKWVQPRRVVQAYQALYACLDKLTFKFAADGDLLWGGSGIAKAETEITTPTFSFSPVAPFNGWEIAATLGGAACTRLVSGSIEIVRNRKPRPLLDGTQDVGISIGNRGISYELEIDFDSKLEYDKFKSAATDALTLKWTANSVTLGTASHPSLELKLGTIAYTEAEVDDGQDLPTLKAKGSALYNSTDASQIVATLRALKDFSA